MTRTHDFDEIIDRAHTNSSKWRAYPPDVLPLWVADSDFKCPAPLVEAVTRAAVHGVYGYPANDEGGFEKATAAWMAKRFGWIIDTDLVDFVPSLGTGLALAVKAFTEKDGAVLMQPPIYPPFRDVAEYNGRKFSCNALIRDETGFRIDFADFERRAADPKTTLFLLCNPHNPTGRAFTREELQRMGEICARNGVYIFSDEIHCDYVFGNNKHIPLATLSPEIAKITVTGVNPSKTFNVAGLRTAAAIATDRQTRERFRAALLSCKLGRNPISIAGYVSAYLECDYYADQVREYVEANIDHAVAFLNERTGGKISAYKPEATYLLWLDCRGLRLPQDKLEAFFLEKAKVALNSGTSFGREGEGYMRLNTACPRSVLEEGLCRIERAVEAL